MESDRTRLDEPDDPGAPPRPLPPPPTVGELFEVFTRRLRLRHPSLDATRVLLVVAALVGLGGMVWAVYGVDRGGGGVVPVAVVSSTTEPVTTVAEGVGTTVAAVDPVIDVAGAVRHPGPVRVRVGDRVFDAIAAAGGATDDADLERVDRAARVVDGQRVYVPRRGQTEIPVVVGATGSTGAGEGAPPGQAPSSGTPTELVDLNNADQTTLETLPGVGPATAQAIIEHRRRHGRFTSVGQLLEVKGIGPAKMAELRPHVTV